MASTVHLESRGPRMLDIVLVVVTIAFFALSLAYVGACDRL